MAEKIADIYYINPGGEHVHRLAVTKLMAMDMLRECLILHMYFVSIFIDYVLNTIAAQFPAGAVNDQWLV